jgi:hypothetical protein
MLQLQLLKPEALLPIQPHRLNPLKQTEITTANPRVNLSILLSPHMRLNSRVMVNLSNINKTLPIPHNPNMGSSLSTERRPRASHSTVRHQPKQPLPQRKDSWACFKARWEGQAPNFQVEQAALRSELVLVCLLADFWHTSGTSMKSMRGVDIIIMGVLVLLVELLVEDFWAVASVVVLA